MPPSRLAMSRWQRHGPAGSARCGRRRCTTASTRTHTSRSRGPALVLRMPRVGDPDGRAVTSPAATALVEQLSPFDAHALDAESGTVCARVDAFAAVEPVDATDARRLEITRATVEDGMITYPPAAPLSRRSRTPPGHRSTPRFAASSHRRTRSIACRPPPRQRCRLTGRRSAPPVCAERIVERSEQEPAEAERRMATSVAARAQLDASQAREPVDRSDQLKVGAKVEATPISPMSRPGRRARSCWSTASSGSATGCTSRTASTSASSTVTDRSAHEEGSKPKGLSWRPRRRDG